MPQFVFPLTARESTDAGRFGPKAANLARLGKAGLPIPDGFAIDAEAYRAQIRALGLEADARGVFAAQESPQARRHALMMKLGLLDQPITPAVLDPLLSAWWELKNKTGALTVVRSSALVEDRFGSSRYRDGHSGSAAGFGAGVGRRFKRGGWGERRRQHDPERDLGAGLGNRARRSDTRSL